MIDVSFNNVSKRYRVRREALVDPTRSRIVRKIQRLRRPAHDFWAVRDVSFEVKRGEALGIIGHNGAGKSTILKMLASITAPTRGEIKIYGRLAALIEVGSGFHPELTGRENIYLNGSILGMRRVEIAEKLDSIVEFAGIREFVDTPVKRFSSGMYVRLGFAIAAHLNPDILLLDEVLAVGDAAFQAKCLKRIDELKAAGTSIVFISHDLGAVERVCDRALLMERGEVVADSSPSHAIDDYQRRSPSGDAPADLVHLSKEASITSVTFHHPRETVRSGYRTGEPIIVRIDFAAKQKIKDVIFEVFFISPEGEIVCHLTTESSDQKINLDSSAGDMEFFCEELGLLPGLYIVDATVIHRGQPLEAAIDWRPRCGTLRVDPGKIVRGKFYMPHEWRIRQFSDSPNDQRLELSSDKFTLPN